MLSQTKLLIFVVFFCHFIPLHAYEDNLPFGGRAAGMAGASVAHADIWSVYNNQAGLCEITSITLALYNDNKLIEELGTKSLVFGIPFKTGTFGVSISSAGLNDAGLQKFGVAFGKKLGEKFSAGLQMDYIRLIQPANYGNDGALTFELGMIANPVENFFIGFHVFNPLRIKYFHQEDQRLYTLIKAGIEYHFTEKFQMAAETEKDLDYAANFKIGCDYNFYKNLYFRLGLATNPVLYSFGLGFNLQRINADVAFSFHDKLGLIPHVSFSYAF